MREAGEACRGPANIGGRGFGPAELAIWNEECNAAGTPKAGIFWVALNHAGPTLIARASEELKRDHLGPIIRGEEVWCQGFSEPGGGSDLAAVRTRGVIDGHELVVNGQKIWTSFAQFADFQELLIRTGDQESRHRGLTWVVCDMHSSGIDIRPIMGSDGIRHFCEVFYDDVRIPLSNVVGEINGGWSVAMTTLGIERGTAGMDQKLSATQEAETLRRIAREHGLLERTDIAEKVAMLRAEAAAMRAMVYREIARNREGVPPGPESSFARLYWNDLHRHTHELAIELIGTQSAELTETVALWLLSFARPIAGGSADIQRNIIGERILGLSR